MFKNNIDNSKMGRNIKAKISRTLSGLFIIICIVSLALPVTVSAIAVPNTNNALTPNPDRGPKRGYNPETGNLSFMGNGDPINVPGVSNINNLTPRQRAMKVASIYGIEFGLKNPSRELTLLKSQKDKGGNDVVRYQQIYNNIPVIAGEMIVNMNSNGELLSINGEVSPNLTIKTKPTIQSQAATKIALTEIAKYYGFDEKELIASNPELWIFDESLLTASTRLVELVWRLEVTAKETDQPIREMVLVNAQTGIVSWHINQVDAQTSTWPVYFDLELDETRGWIYGSDTNGHKIDVISMTTLELVKSFILVNGASPKGIALSPDGSELAIAQGGASSILFLNPDTGETIASVIPNTNYTKSPYDVIYGRSNRLYTSSSYNSYIHVIDLTTHTEISRSSSVFMSYTRLAISEDKDWLYASHSSGSPMKLYKFDVSTDTLPYPIISTAHNSGFSASTYILDTVNNLIFTNTGQVWTSDLKGKVGTTDFTGYATYIPSQNAVAVASSSTNGIAFVSAENFYTLSTYPLQGTMGPIVSQADGNKVFVSTSYGIASVELSNFPPGTPGTLPVGNLPYFDLILDETRGILYGSNTSGHKIDIISSSTLQVIDQIQLHNGASPYGMDLSPDGNELTVALHGASSLAFINTNTRTISAMAMPTLDGAIYPFDVKYGRTGRLYSSGSGPGDYIHIFDTSTHTEINYSPVDNIYSSPYLSISADKNWLYTIRGSGSPRFLYRLDVSTDVPAILKSVETGYPSSNFLLSENNNKIFTNGGQVWLPDLNAQIGSFSASGNLVEIPMQNLVAVLSTSNPGSIDFIKSTDYYTASTTHLPSIEDVGASVLSFAGDNLFINTNSGIKALDISPNSPTSITVSSGSSQSVQVNTQFQQPLKVRVQNVAGNPMSNIVVTFTAPISNASITFEDTNSNVTTATTDENGIATSSILTANNVAGSYSIDATVSNFETSASFQLTNLAAASCAVSNGSEPESLFLPYKFYNCGNISHGVAVGDFNNDGKNDVALSSWGSLFVFLQDNNGNMLQPHVYVGGSSYLSAGDVNNDGLDDIISADYNADTVDVYLQRTDGVLAYPISYPADTSPNSIAIGDVNNDDLIDVVISHSFNPVIGVFIQNQSGTFNPMVSYSSANSGNDDIAIGDVNNDGLNDVVKMNGQRYTNPNLQVYLQNLDGTLGTAIPYSLGCNCLGAGIGIGDVTGDGRSDVIMSYGGNRPDAKIAVFAQDTNGNLQSPISYASYDIPVPVEIADVNSDNLLDVITLHNAWGRAGTYLQQLDRSLGSESLYLLPYVNSSYLPNDLKIDDVNNDGLPDLIMANYRGLVILYRNPTPPPPPTPTFTPGPTFTPSPTSTPGPGPSRTPGPTSTPGASPTPVSSSSTGIRRTYTTSGGTTLPGTFLCDESQSICTNGANLDADSAHQYAADTFVFYNTHHSRNSFDNHGSAIISTVDYGINYRNAFWTGYQMVYGDLMAADDVVGHEITHGVTQYTSNLIYAYQSGAINESFSDVWGEFIDQTNGSGNDTASVKWLMGEDTPLGVIRSMSNPPAYGDPDKMSSPYYYTGPGDNGGVHINSGVNNKAAYLMVEGGTFNSRTIFGIGLDKAAAIYYEAQSNLLTAGSNYNDLYYALNQACQNLIGGVDNITQYDCDQVKTAAEAVEMVILHPSTPTPTHTPINTSTFTPTASRTPTNTLTFTPTPSYTPSNTSTFTPTHTATSTPTASSTPSNTPTYTPTVSYTPSNTATITLTSPSLSYPVVSSITRAAPNPTSALSVDFTVDFSEFVSGVDTSDFTLVTTRITDATITNVSGSGNIYTVTVSTGSGNGTIRLDVVDDNSILDAASHPLGGPNMGDGNFTSRETYTITKGSTFDDVPESYWAWSYIERLYNSGITGGCNTSPLMYCSETTVTRSQMAVFLLRGIHGSSYNPPAVGASTGFGDVPVNYWSAGWIKQLAAEGITGGCGSRNYCPEYPVTRDQMAVFLLRSKYGSSYNPPAAGGSTGFGDVPANHWAAAWIKQLVAEGITSGCGNGNYCPEYPVSRAQMAVFLVRTFGLP